MKTAKVLVFSGSLVIFCLIIFVALHYRTGPSASAAFSHIKWSFSAGHGSLSGIALAPDGAIHFAAVDGLYSLSSGGKLQWKVPLPSGPVVAAPAMASDGSLYFASQSGKLFALDKSGKLLWESAEELKHKFLTPPALGDGPALYASDEYSNIFAFAPGVQTNRSWDLVTYDRSANKDGLLLGNNFYSQWYTSPVIGSDGTIYLVHQSYLYQISSSGEILRFAQFYGGTGFPAIGQSGIVYIGAHYSPWLTAVDRQGKTLWNTRTSHPVQGSPVIDNAGVIYLCDSDFVKAVEPEGRQKWFLQADCNSGPALAADGTLYLGMSVRSQDYERRKMYLLAVNSDGTLKWQTEIQGMVRDAPAIAPDGTIFLTTDQGYVYSVFDSGAPPMDSPWPRFQHDAQNSGRIPYDP